MDPEYKTKIARELLELHGPHDGESLSEALQDLISAGARDGLGNAVADMRERCAETARLGGRRAALAFFDNADEMAHHSVVVWLVSARLDLRAVADLVAACHEPHVWADALQHLQAWVESL